MIRSGGHCSQQVGGGGGGEALSAARVHHSSTWMAIRVWWVLKIAVIA